MVQEQFQGTIGGLLPRLVAVKDEHGAIGQATEGPDMVVSQGGPEGADHVGQADLMGRHDVGVPFDDGDPAELAGGLAGEVDGVEVPSLLEERRLGGVEVLGDAEAGVDHPTLGFGHDPAAEADRAASDVADREDQAAPEAVADVPVAPDGQAGAFEDLDLEARLGGAADHPVTAVGGIADPEGVDDLGREAAASEIRASLV